MSGADLPNKYKGEDLKNSKYAYEKYMTAKYYKNLTESQYTSAKAPTSVASSVQRESLNPAINLNRLRDRIATTEAIKARYTVIQKDWLRLCLERVGGQAWKYKFNYLLKFALLYKAYSEISNYRYLKKNTVMSLQANSAHWMSITQWGGISFLTFCLI